MLDGSPSIEFKNELDLLLITSTGILRRVPRASADAALNKKGLTTVGPFLLAVTLPRLGHESPVHRACQVHTIFTYGTNYSTRVAGILQIRRCIN